MKDITGYANGDLNVLDSQAAKAANVLQIQLGDLEYAPTFGVDLDFFLDPDFNFQNESFKSYLIQRLTESHVNVDQVLEALNTFALNFTFVVGGESESSTGGFIR